MFGLSLNMIFAILVFLVTGVVTILVLTQWFREERGRINRSQH